MAPVAVMPERPGLLEALGEAEVGEAGGAVLAEQHVVGLEVAVDEAGVVRGGEALERVHGDAQADGRGTRPPRAGGAPRRCRPAQYSSAK